MEDLTGTDRHTENEIKNRLRETKKADIRGNEG